MRNRTENPSYCIQCGAKLPNPTMVGAKCASCIIRQNEQYAAQRLAGQIPPKGTSV